VGKVDWYIDNMGVINNFRKMHRWGVANDWSKAGDRDVPSSTRYNGSTGFGRYSPLGGAGNGEGSEECRRCISSADSGSAEQLNRSGSSIPGQIRSQNQKKLSA
jgi:hypothetical protein